MNLPFGYWVRMLTDEEMEERAVRLNVFLIRRPELMFLVLMFQIWSVAVYL